MSLQLIAGDEIPNAIDLAERKNAEKKMSKKNTEKKMSKELMPKKKCRNKNVDAVYAEEKNVDHIKMSKEVQAVVQRHC